MNLFTIHLDLLGIPHRKQDLPTLVFDTMDTESPLNLMQRVSLGYTSGIMTLNQALDELNLPPAKENGDERVSDKDATTEEDMGELPRENSQPGKSAGN